MKTAPMLKNVSFQTSFFSCHWKPKKEHSSRKVSLIKGRFLLCGLWFSVTFLNFQPKPVSTFVTEDCCISSLYEVARKMSDIPAGIWVPFVDLSEWIEFVGLSKMLINK